MAVLDSAERSTQLPYGRRWLAEVVFALDARLRRRHAVFEYTHNPACVFRLDIVRAPRSLALRDGTRVRAGQRIARLHFWNEQVPPVPESGPTIAWARQMRRALAISLQELARYFASRPDLGDIALISGDAPSGTAAQRDQLARIMERFGFEAVVVPENLPIRERLHRLGENILISLIVLAHNAGALRSDSLMRVRLPIHLSRRILERKFGRLAKPASDGNVAEV
jgi:hypothetical protein